MAAGANIRCAKCGAENRDTAKFCDGCGTPIEAKCASCGTLNRAGARFCDGCGTALSSQPPGSVKSARAPEDRVRVRAEQPVGDALEGERKMVTALFADIKGSTEPEQDLDPEEARAIVDPALKLMIDAVRRYDGCIAAEFREHFIRATNCGLPIPSRHAGNVTFCVFDSSTRHRREGVWKETAQRLDGI